MKKVWKVTSAIGTVGVLGAAAAIGKSYQIFVNTLGRDRKLPVRPDTGSHGENPFGKMFEQGKAWALEHKEECRRLEIQNKGLSLAGYFYSQGSEKTVILVHGLTGCYLDRLCDAQVYYDRGYNILSVDCRGHGESDGKYRTMGYWDGQDVICWTEYLVGKEGQKAIVLDGVSMGGATVLSASGDEKLPSQVKGIISDCAYTSIYEIFKYQLEKFIKLPQVPFLNLIEVYCNKIAHISLIARSPMDSVKHAKVPILFIHGVDDVFVPYEMSQALKRVCSAPKRLYSVKGAGHGTARFTDAQGCTTIITQFLETIEL